MHSVLRVVAAVAVLAAAALAQPTVRVTGNVSGAINAGVSAVTVRLIRTNLPTLETNASVSRCGEFTFFIPPAAEVVLEVSAPGYRPFRRITQANTDALLGTLPLERIDQPLIEMIAKAACTPPDPSHIYFDLPVKDRKALFL